MKHICDTHPSCRIWESLSPRRWRSAVRCQRFARASGALSHLIRWMMALAISGTPLTPWCFTSLCPSWPRICKNYDLAIFVDAHVGSTIPEPHPRGAAGGDLPDALCLPPDAPLDGAGPDPADVSAAPQKPSCSRCLATILTSERDYQRRPRHWLCPPSTVSLSSPLHLILRMLRDDSLSRFEQRMFREAGCPSERSGRMTVMHRWR